MEIEWSFGGLFVIAASSLLFVMPVPAGAQSSPSGPSLMKREYRR
jgi:hypothetical protein